MSMRYILFGDALLLSSNGEGSLLGLEDELSRTSTCDNLCFGMLNFVL